MFTKCIEYIYRNKFEMCDNLIRFMKTFHFVLTFKLKFMYFLSNHNLLAQLKYLPRCNINLNKKCIN